MGVVYLATDGRQLAAVKTVHPQLLDEPGFRDRFEREARVAQRVDSPRVARLLYEHGESGGNGAHTPASADTAAVVG